METGFSPLYCIHHRKPGREGGDDSDENTSRVLLMEHQAWNILFDGYPVEKIAKLLERYWERFGNPKAFLEAKEKIVSILKAPKKKTDKRIYKAPELRRIRALGVRESIAKKMFAWTLLFYGLSVEEIVNVINNIWLDPEFEITAEIIEVVKISIINKKIA